MFPEELIVVYIGSTLHDVGAVMSGGLVEGGGSAAGFWGGLVAVVLFTIGGTLFARRRLAQITDRFRKEAAKREAQGVTDGLVYSDEEWEREERAWRSAENRKSPTKAPDGHVGEEGVLEPVLAWPDDGPGPGPGVAAPVVAPTVREAVV